MFVVCVPFVLCYFVVLSQFGPGVGAILTIFLEKRFDEQTCEDWKTIVCNFEILDY